MRDDVLYRKSFLQRLGEVKKLVPDATESFLSFEKEAFAPGLLPNKTKELIAIATAHVTGCPYCIEVHVAKFKQLGGTKEEMMEAIVVAGAVKAGAALSHSVNALNAFEPLPARP